MTKIIDLTQYYYTQVQINEFLKDSEENINDAIELLIEQLE